MICNHVVVAATTDSTLTIMPTGVITTVHEATTVSKVRSSTMIMILATNNPNDTDILNDKGDAFDFLQDVCVHM